MTVAELIAALQRTPSDREVRIWGPGTIIPSMPVGSITTVALPDGTRCTLLQPFGAGPVPGDTTR